MNKRMQLFFLLTAAPYFLAFFAACDNGGSSPVPIIPMFQTQTVHLENQSLYLVKVNRSDTTVGYNYTGRASSVTGAGGRTSTDIPLLLSAAGAPDAAVYGGETVIRREHEGARRFNSNPPPISPEQPSPLGLLRLTTLPKPEDQAEGSTTWDCWVDDKNGNFSKKTATLRAQSAKANVWVVNDNFDASSSTDNDNKITTTQAREIADKFNSVYGFATNVFGYEYGAASGQTSGGKDGDTRIQILIYDIDFDYTVAQNGGTVGFFWGKDYYTQNWLNDNGYSNLKTNESEIFYIDAHFTDRYPGTAYSTLVHEFQHMIHFNEKYVRKGKSSATWYNEMLSMLAEDMISPKIGVTDPDDLPTHRLKTFVNFYSEGVTTWYDGNNVLISYDRCRCKKHKKRMVVGVDVKNIKNEWW
jgi:hypothetical protein